MISNLITTMLLSVVLSMCLCVLGAPFWFMCLASFALGVMRSASYEKSKK